jgi:hypothetical protein
MIPLPQSVDWTPLLKAHEKGTLRKIVNLKRREITYNGEMYYEFEVEGHELDSYSVKIVKNKYGARGSCHCRDFECRKLPAFNHDGVKGWCKHLLSCYLSIEELEQEEILAIA